MRLTVNKRQRKKNKAKGCLNHEEIQFSMMASMLGMSYKEIRRIIKKKRREANESNTNRRNQTPC